MNKNDLQLAVDKMFFSSLYYAADCSHTLGHPLKRTHARSRQQRGICMQMWLCCWEEEVKRECLGERAWVMLWQWRRNEEGRLSSESERERESACVCVCPKRQHICMVSIVTHRPNSRWLSVIFYLFFFITPASRSARLTLSSCLDIDTRLQKAPKDFGTFKRD